MSHRTTTAAAIDRYGEERGAEYMKYYRKGFRQQRWAGRNTHIDLHIEGGQNRWLEDAYRQGSADARKRKEELRR